MQKVIKIKIEKRDSVLFVRLKKANKDWIEAQAKVSDCSESKWLDALIEQLRKQ